MTPETLGLWAGTMLLISLTPGAGAVASMSAGALHGWRRGLATACGQQAALLLEWTVAVAGLASILETSPGLFAFLRWIGVAYLLWMGWNLWKPPLIVPPESGSGGDPDSGWGRLFLHGFLANATNPKAWLSLVAIAPGFIDPSGPLIPQAAAMGAVMVAIDLAVMSGYTAVGACCFRARAGRPGLHGVRIRRLFGLLYGVAAAALALAA